MTKKEIDAKIGEWKELMTKQLTEDFKKRPNFYLTSYTGLASPELNEFRRLLEPSASRYFVVKNSIAKIALEKAGLGELNRFFKGGVGVVFGGSDPFLCAKIIHNFSRSHEFIKPIGGYLEGRVLDGEQVKSLALLPSKKGLIRKVVIGIKSPIIGFVSVLGNTLNKFVRVLHAIKDKKGG